ncbi:MAG TPA: stage II sporulation protein E [Planctomycetaceae bacterium]|nr:stage II sporulation protein E [Planctomycetaceae bacterium]|tara:strand:- start:86 stop:1732 length:1647 start_codon:yes stop_codon:yes gene_type:complete
MPRLVLLKDGQPIPYDLDEYPVQLGRHPDCAIQLESTMVSRFHAQLVDADEGVSIEDLASGNGSFLNGRPLDANTPIPLSHGDRIKLGPVKFRYEDENADDSRLQVAYGLDVDDDTSSTIMGSAAAGGYGLLDVRPEDKLKGILKINQALAGTVEIRNISPRIIEALFEIFPQADRCSILIREHQDAPLIPVAQKYRDENNDETVRLSRTILETVLGNKEGILSADAASDSRFSASESISSLTIHSMMCVPMLDLDEKPFGVINLDTQNPMKRFTDDDLQLLLAVASQSASAYENARLLVSHVAKQKQDKEMNIARGVQQALLPSDLPQVEGYQFYASYDAAAEVGGDYFDCFMIGEDKVCVSFGDVAGKGVPGALIMSRMSSVVQNTMTFTDDVEVAIQRINDHMCHNMVEGRFVTYILGVIDLKKNRITLTNAGHMSPVIRKADGSIEEFDDDMIGIPIGIMDGYPYQIVEQDIEPGDIFTLITDGVDEAMNPAGDLYGKNRVVEFVKNGSTDPEQLGREMLADVRSHADGRAQNDDITIMVFGRV